MTSFYTVSSLSLGIGTDLEGIQFSYLLGCDQSTYFAASEQQKLNGRGRCLDISSYFKYTLMFALKSHLWNAQQARWVPGFQRNFAALFVLSFCSRECPLFAIANFFEFRCQQKQLLLFQNLSLFPVE